MSESSLAYAITQMLWSELPEDAVDFHVPNEGRRSRYEASEFLRSGSKAGIPDRWILWQGRAYCWEEKDGDSKPNANQRKMFPRLEAAGFPVPLIRSVDEARAQLRAWGIPLAPRSIPATPAQSPAKQASRARRRSSARRQECPAASGT